MKKIIIIIGGGRLGNQIFQYAFAKKISPQKSIIFAANWESLRELFEIEDLLILAPKMKIFKYLIWKFGKKFLKLLGRMGIFDYYEQLCRDTYTNEYIYKKGIFSFIKVINFGYYQAESFFDEEIKNKLIIREKYLKIASHILIKNTPINCERVFVHIRRGDYVALKADLPINYYRKAIKYFENKLKNPYFIFLSDDIEYVKGVFDYLRGKSYFSNNNLYVDFAIMTLCEYGIISNSTFSYWGGI